MLKTEHRLSTLKNRLMINERRNVYDVEAKIENREKSIGQLKIYNVIKPDKRIISSTEWLKKEKRSFKK